MGGCGGCGGCVVVVVCGWGGRRNGREKDLERSFSKMVNFDRWRPFLENGWVVAKHPIDQCNGRSFLNGRKRSFSKQTVFAS